MKYIEAYCGLDKVKGEDGIPLHKTLSAWSWWAICRAKEKSKKDGITWHVQYFQREDGDLRISFASQDEKTNLVRK